ncbi:MAG: hypothetical protein NZM43_10070 [Saprospiraceae bacterium]|nr:hypothetical protein [Saprospiraceae bacterium]MDW8484660.1 hypothetical protein [Saprospiraceae bacterium]
MSPEGFSTLTAQEFDTLRQVPLWITLLIGGADDTFDRSERDWAARIVRIRTYAREGSFDEYYRQVAENFVNRLDELWESLPSDAESRNQLLAEKIAEVNPILAKLHPPLGALLYQSYCKLADEVAKASGGFLRIGAVSPEENRWVKLPMLTPIYSEEASLFAKWEEDDSSGLKT